MSSEDFGAILTRLRAILAEQTDVQVIVGALMRPQLSSAVPSSQLLYASGDDHLF
jgi:hypothetical protein